ncbi:MULTISPECIES: LPS translocon maturation chaperone LptM [unclassified Nitrosospira]|nr:lipoprotein [Nitrosospira sp. Is2]WON74841.1 lipoprotein [Nitrosospira sp. Is2]
MRTFCTTVLILLLLNACGLKAPLYLPQEPIAPQPQQSQDAEKRR